MTAGQSITQRSPPLFFRRLSTLLRSPDADDQQPPPNTLGALLTVALSSAALSAFTTSALFLAWVRRFRPPKLHYDPTPENEAIVRHLPLLHRTYVPNMLAWNAHLAGIFGYLKLPGRPLKNRELITLPDGGTVALSWQNDPPREDDGQRVVILFPGINNDSRMPYIRHLSNLLEREGLGHICAVDWRGLGGQELRSVSGTPKPYCAACNADIGFVLAHLRARLPRTPFFGVGWSMGGCLMLRHMGEAADECLLSGAMAVSPLLDIEKGYTNFARTLLGKYGYVPVIMAPLVAYLWRHRHALSQGERPIHFARDVLLRALRQESGLDDCIYGPAWGVGGKEGYWEHSSAGRVISSVCRPTLIIHSEDDPICPLEAMPLAEMTANAHIITALTRHGGHMGYTAGLSPLTHTWTDRLLVHYLRHFDNRPSTNGAEGTWTGGGAAGECVSPAAAAGSQQSPRVARAEIAYAHVPPCDGPWLPPVCVPSRL